MYNFERVRKALINEYSTHYNFNYSVLSLISGLPKEVNLYILEFYINTLNKQLVLVDEDEAIYLMVYLTMIACRANYGYEYYDYFPSHHPITTFLDDHIHFF